MTRLMRVFLAALVLASPGAQAADLVVWWEKGAYAQEDKAVADIIAAFEQKTGKQIELVQPRQEEIFGKLQAAFAAGRPPDFLFGAFAIQWAPQSAYADQLVDLESAIGPALALFDADAIDLSTMLDGKTGRRALYALPMDRYSNHIHVWNSLLERAGFTLADIPKQWEAFWSFWCDRVQPAVRRVTGRDDIWGIGLPMSAAATETGDQLLQFELGYGTPWLGIDGRLQIDDPTIRAGIVKALDAYTLIWRKGCTPPDSTSWTNLGNNQAFLAQKVVMTPNESLSIPGALRATRPDDYYKNTATIDWPNRVDGQTLVIEGGLHRAVVFRAGGNPALASDFVRFLAQEGWLAHWLDFIGDRWFPPMRQLVDQPFWLNPNDPHRMRAAIQILTQPQLLIQDVRDHEWRSGLIPEELVWSKAVHRVVADGISPEQAVDEAIARIKQILAE
jgi:multiple sugar transport system substrate-binding protein